MAVLVVGLSSHSHLSDWLCSNRCVAPVGWCLMTATVSWRLHIRNRAPCASVWFSSWRSVPTEQWFGIGWRGVGQVPWGWHRARRPWQTGDLGFVTSSASSGHHGINFPPLFNKWERDPVCYCWCPGEIRSPFANRNKHFTNLSHWIISRMSFNLWKVAFSSSSFSLAGSNISPFCFHPGSNK